MSDYNSSLPIRTQSDGDAVIKICDATVTTRQLTVNADGSVNVVATATNLDIRDLSHTQDSVKVGDGTDFLAIATDGSIAVTDNGASLTVDATNLDIRDLAFATDKVDASGSEVSLDATTLAALESITVQNGTGGSAVNIQDGGNSITVDGSVTVSATDLDIRDLAAATDSVSAWIKDEAGNAFSSTNPLPVVLLESEGIEVNDYSTAAAVASAGTSNHDYTVTATKTLQLTQIEATASGKAKIEVQIESGVASGVFATKFIQFNSTAVPNMSVILKEPISVAAGVRVRVIRTNKDNQSQDLYSTICGHETT